MENVTIIENGWTKEATIYTIEELQKQEVPDDIDAWLDDLYISMCVNMWRYCHINDDKTSQELIDIMSSDERFMYNNKWSKEQRAGYEHIFYNILVNKAKFDADDAWQNIEQFSAFGPAFTLDDMSDENFSEYRKLVADISHDEVA